MPTRIEWAEETWNPITGCTPVSEGCAHCYAKRMANRFAGRYGYPADEPFRVTFHEDKVDAPLHWRKPRLVFVCSMGDLFHDDVRPEWLARIMDTMSTWFDTGDPGTEWTHTYLLLTKRPQNVIPKLLEAADWAGDHLPDDTPWNTWLEAVDTLIPDNIGIGVTVENQQQAFGRIRPMWDAKPALRFVSYEPALGPLNLANWAYTVDWIVAGAETGPRARPANLDWFRRVRDQCAEAGVPFLLKKINSQGDRHLDGAIHDEFPDWCMPGKDT